MFLQAGNPHLLNDNLDSVKPETNVDESDANKKEDIEKTITAVLSETGQ